VAFELPDEGAASMAALDTIAATPKRIACFNTDFMIISQRRTIAKDHVIDACISQLPAVFGSVRRIAPAAAWSL